MTEILKSKIIYSIKGGRGGILLDIEIGIICDHFQKKCAISLLVLIFESHMKILREISYFPKILAGGILLVLGQNFG